MTLLTYLVLIFAISLGPASTAYALTEQDMKDYQIRVLHEELLIKARALFIKGTESVRIGHLVDALAEIEEGLNLEPDNENALYNKAVILQTVGRFNEAMNAYDYIITKHPRSQAADYARAMLANLGAIRDTEGSSNGNDSKLAKAHQADGKSSSVLSDSINVLRAEGTEALRERRYDIAENKFTTLLEIDKTDAGAWYYLGQAYGNKLEYEKAINAYSTSLEINPRSLVANDARKSLQVLSTAIHQAEPVADPLSGTNVIEQSTKGEKAMTLGDRDNDQPLVPLQ